LFLPTLVLNAAMIPAILVHGGHHLVDLIGGAATFAIAYALAARVLKEVTQDSARQDTGGAQHP
jgi:membrane-associated phospholipid phosphatase